MYAIRFEYPGLVALVRRRLVGTRVDMTLGSGSELRNVHVQGKKCGRRDICRLVVDFPFCLVVDGWKIRMSVL
jgi:hypothetical protein